MREVRRGRVYWWNNPRPKSGHLQSGRRPCIVISNDVCNARSPVVTIVPCTSKAHKPYPQQAPFVLQGGLTVALGDQLTSIPVSELDDYICTLKDFQLEQVEKAVLVQLGLVPTTDPADLPVEKSVETVQNPKPQKKEPNKEPKKRMRWNDDNILQFLIDFEEGKMEVMKTKYGLSEATIHRYYLNFKKKNR